MLSIVPLKRPSHGFPAWARTVLTTTTYGWGVLTLATFILRLDPVPFIAVGFTLAIAWVAVIENKAAKDRMRITALLERAEKASTPDYDVMVEDIINNIRRMEDH